MSCSLQVVQGDVGNPSKWCIRCLHRVGCERHDYSCLSEW